ncbi:MAG: YIP1 family protein [Rhodobacteraceae bacterium]|nr:YIP1 family protein [Paracoccaceae bacterium]
MTFPDFKNLIVISVTEPAKAAVFLTKLAVPRDVLWASLILVAILNTILLTVFHLLVPSLTNVPAMPNHPFSSLVFFVCGLILIIYGIFWTGRWMGGQGTLEDVMTLMVWLQMLQVIFQAGTLILIILLPTLAAFAVIGEAILGTYILLHFVNAGHQLNSLWHAAGVVIALVALVAIVIVLVLPLFWVTLAGGLV